MEVVFYAAEYMGLKFICVNELSQRKLRSMDAFFYTNWNFTRSILLAMLLQFGAFSAVADTVTDADGEPGSQLIETIETLKQQIETHRSDLPDVEGESQKALFLQIMTQEDELRTALADLLDLISEQGKGNGQTAPLKKRMTQYVEEQAVVVREDINTLREMLSQLNETDRSEMSFEEVEIHIISIVQINDFLDILYAAAAENIERQKALKLDFSANLQRLEALLTDRAEVLEGFVELTSAQIDLLENRINRIPATAAGSAAEKSQQDLFLLEEQMDGSARSLAAMVVLMANAGLETSHYRLTLIEATGDFGSHIFNLKVISGLFSKLYDNSLEWLANNGLSLLLKLLVVVVILLVFKVVAAMAGKLVRRGLDNSGLSLSTLLKDFFVSMATKLVMLIGFLIVLSQFGVEIGPALAGLGVLGFIVGFALQETLANFASGLMILVYRPFDVGDLVEVAGKVGIVKLMSLVSTTIVTLDNQRLVVPNTKIWGDVIRNVTAEKTRRVDLVFGIGYEDDIAHAEKILTDIVESHPLVLKNPKADIKLHTLNESSVDFVVRPWIRTEDYWTVYWDITRAVKDRFDQEGISIPYPHQDIHMYGVPAEALPQVSS
ncbi:MAG: mechanosensitive ion channel protein MscS [Chloroflexota bacterium]|nr:MAG: mechanosensitive ion channel protein MscS [Chloroflexota bacterium]